MAGGTLGVEDVSFNDPVYTCVSGQRILSFLSFIRESSKEFMDGEENDFVVDDGGFSLLGDEWKVYKRSERDGRHPNALDLDSIVIGKADEPTAMV